MALLPTQGETSSSNTYPVVLSTITVLLAGASSVGALGNAFLTCTVLGTQGTVVPVGVNPSATYLGPLANSMSRWSANMSLVLVGVVAAIAL
jgi:hypothetical protein